jgi:hypothetical protein
MNETINQLRKAYKQKDEILKKLADIEKNDPIYTIDKLFHWEYDEEYGMEWKQLKDDLEKLYRKIHLLEECLGIGVFMTHRGLAIVTLKEEGE